MLGLKESLNSSSLTKPATGSPIELLRSRNLERAQLGPFSLRAAMYGVRHPQWQADSCLVSRITDNFSIVVILL